MTPLLAFDQVGFHFGNRTILADAGVSLQPGTATAIIGPNGAGKTTLLRLAAGILQPASGRISFQGQPLTSLSARGIARGIALVPQEMDVPFEYTAEQVVAQGRTPYLRLLRGLTVTDRRAIDQAFEQTGTSHLRHRVFNQLSGGERQRVRIALGLAQQPRLLLLDEPAQNLDIGRQMDLLALLRYLQAGGLTVLASMHDLHLIQGNFSTVILLRPGLPLLHGPSSELLEERTLREAFSCPPGEHPFFTHLR